MSVTDTRAERAASVRGCSVAFPVDRLPRLSVMLGLLAFVVLRVGMWFLAVKAEVEFAVEYNLCMKETNDAVTCQVGEPIYMSLYTIGEASHGLT
jgi:hypothetical protein